MRSGHVLAVVAASLLAACAPAMPKASMADRDPLRRAVVEDVADGMSRMFDAASTPLVVTREPGGAFDTALRAALRGKGFTFEAAEAQGAAFDCRVYLLEGRMYRVTVRVGKTELTRAWVVDGAAAYAGGAWVRRE